ncbi:hypothetical protein BKI52_16570 [marine bacterium AO1-C]|nr:hypothetical protein BKI52_16570 [marine bacterium AO1-C]
MPQLSLIRYLHWIKFISLLYVFTSCQNNPTNERFVIAFSQCTNDDAFQKNMLREMERELVFYPEVTFLFEDAHNNLQEQIKDIDNLLKKPIDALIVVPLEARGMTPVIEKAYAKGIPVILVDRTVNTNKFTAYIGVDNRNIGRKAGHYLAQLLNGQGQVLEISGQVGSSPSLERHAGFLEAIRQYPDILVSKEIYGNWETEKAKVALEKVIEKYKGIDAIFTQNDLMAQGAYEVCKKYGLNDQIKIVSIDALPGDSGGIQMVLDKKIEATFLNPTGGEEAIRITMKILKKESYVKINHLPTLGIAYEDALVWKNQTDKVINEEKIIALKEHRLAKDQALFKYFSLLIVALAIVTILVLVILFQSARKRRQLQLYADKIASHSEVLEDHATELENTQRQLEHRNEELQAQKEDLNRHMEEVLTLQEHMEQKQIQIEKTNQDLESQKVTLEQLYQVLRRKNTAITDSLRYAKGIQQTIFPSESELKRVFQEHFIIYQPKDIVSGDFYWMYRQNHKAFFVVADCTGHGVPGAFMSIIGYSLLKEIIVLKKIHQPDHILSILHKEVIHTLKQFENNMDDGMDIVIITLEAIRGVGKINLQFSGARNELMYVSNQEVMVLKGDRQSIGGYSVGGKPTFKLRQMTLDGEDGIIYLFTDGFADTPNPKRRCFGSRRLKTMMVDVGRFPLEQQKEKFLNALKTHAQETPNRDDITLLGLKPNFDLLLEKTS